MQLEKKNNTKKCIKTLRVVVAYRDYSNNNRSCVTNCSDCFENILKLVSI